MHPRTIRASKVIAGMLAVSLFGAADAPTAPSAAAVPEVRTLESWVKGHESFAARSKKGDVDVLFLGDSLTARWEVEGKNAWTGLPSGWKSAHYGLGGDRTQNLLWRIGAGRELAGIDPKVIVLLIGTNNIGGDSPAEIAAGVKAILSELRKQKPKSHVLLLGLLPRLGKPVATADKDVPPENLHPKVAAINARLAPFDDDAVTFVDVGPKILDGDGKMPRSAMPDYLHLSAEGYAAFAAALRRPVDDLLSGKPAPKAHAKAAYRRVDALRGHLMMWVSAANR